MHRLRRAISRAAKDVRAQSLRRAGAAVARFSTPEVGSAPVPTESQLRRWAVVEGVEYQAWAFHHGFLTLEEWRNQRVEALARDHTSAPLISVLTPVYNTRLDHLRECVYSVQVQSYPFWELCLVDDASTDRATVAEAERLAASDSRIQLVRLQENRGICGATNVALEQATGSHVAFVDHDDRLAPDALHHVAALLTDEPDLDGIYSDRDFVTAANYRTNPLFKPNWAPETLLAGNYMFHLVVYRRELVEDLGGYRREFEGSQDLDLALRVAESDPKVAHVARVLYHWRQHDDSMAGDPEAKPYIFDAGVRAVEAALERRGIDGTVEEIPTRWRGNYQVRLAASPATVDLIRVDDPATYAATVAAGLAEATADHVVVLHSSVSIGDDDLEQMLAWLDQPGIGATTARVVSPGGWLRHAGLVRRPSGAPAAPFACHRLDEPGHGAMTVIVRNISLVHPFACAWRTDVLRTVGVDRAFSGPHTLLDASIRAEHGGHRLLYVPTTTVTSDSIVFDPETWPDTEAQALAARHGDDLAFDWQFHWALDRDRPDGRIGLAAPDYESDIEGVS